MLKDYSFKEAIFPYLEKYQFCIGACGVKYGSVAYIAFGELIIETRPGKHQLYHYPVNLLFGADIWDLSQEGKLIMNSDFENVHTTRSKLEELLIGRTLVDIVTVEDESHVIFSEGLILSSYIMSEYASDFLFSFYVENGPIWETIDGKSMKK
jgi:hypothetical protein